MARYPQLPPGHIVSISRKISAFRDAGQLNDPNCIRLVNKLVQANLRLVVHIWRLQFVRVVEPSDDRLADLLQEGAMGLCRSAQLYDPTRGYTFATYAPFWIRKGFHDFLKQQARLVRLPYAAVRALGMAAKINEAADCQNRSLHKNDLQWIAKACKTTPDTVSMYMDRARITSVLSLNSVNDDGMEMLGTVMSDARDLHQQLNETQAMKDFELIASRAKLSADDRMLVLSRMDEISYEELESRLPYLKSPRTQHRAAMDRLRRVARETGKPPSLCAA